MSERESAPRQRGVARDDASVTASTGGRGEYQGRVMGAWA
jgi:hypothetical protein